MAVIAVVGDGGTTGDVADDGADAVADNGTTDAVANGSTADAVADGGVVVGVVADVNGQLSGIVKRSINLI